MQSFSMFLLKTHAASHCAALFWQVREEVLMLQLWGQKSCWSAAVSWVWATWRRVCVCVWERERERERTNKQTNNRWRTSCGGAALQRRWEKDLLNYSKYVFFFSTSIFSSQSPTNTSDMCTTVARKHLQLQINSQSTINRQSIDNQSINMFNERKYLNFGSSVISVGFFIRSSDFDFFAFSLEDFTSRVLRRL